MTQFASPYGAAAAAQKKRIPGAPNSNPVAANRNPASYGVPPVNMSYQQQMTQRQQPRSPQQGMAQGQGQGYVNPQASMAQRQGQGHVNPQASMAQRQGQGGLPPAQNQQQMMQQAQAPRQTPYNPQGAMAQAQRPVSPQQQMAAAQRPSGGGQPNYQAQQQAMQRAQSGNPQAAMQQAQAPNGQPPRMPGETIDDWFVRLDQMNGNGPANQPPQMDYHTEMSPAQAASNAQLYGTPSGATPAQQQMAEAQGQGAPPPPSPEELYQGQQQTPEAMQAYQQGQTPQGGYYPQGQLSNYQNAQYNAPKPVGMMTGREFDPSNPLDPSVGITDYGTGLVDNQNRSTEGTYQDYTQDQEQQFSQQQLMDLLSGGQGYADQGLDASKYQTLDEYGNPIQQGYNQQGSEVNLGYGDDRSQYGALQETSGSPDIQMEDLTYSQDYQFGRDYASGLEVQIGNAIDQLQIDPVAEKQKAEDALTLQFQQQREQLARQYALDPSGTANGAAQRAFETLGAQEAMAKAQSAATIDAQLRNEQRQNISTMTQTQQGMQQFDLANRTDYLAQKGLEVQAAQLTETARQFDENLRAQINQQAQSYGLDSAQTQAQIDKTYADLNNQTKQTDSNIDQMVQSGNLDVSKFNMSLDQYKSQVMQTQLQRQSDMLQFSSQFGLDSAKFEQAVNESDRQFALVNQQAAQKYGLDEAQFNLAQWQVRDNAQARDVARQDSVTQFAQKFNLDATQVNSAIADTQAKWELTNQQTAHQFGLDDQNFQMARQEMQEKIRIQDKELDDRKQGLADQFGLDKDKFSYAMSEADRQFQQAALSGQQQFELDTAKLAHQWGMDEQQFTLAEAQFNSDRDYRQQGLLVQQEQSARAYGLDVARFSQASQESDRQMDTQEQQIAQQYGLQQDQLALAKYQAQQAATAQFQDLGLRADTAAKQYGLDAGRFKQAVAESDRSFKLQEGQVVQQMGINEQQFSMAKQQFDTSQYRQQLMWDSATRHAMNDDGTMDWLKGDQHEQLAASIMLGTNFQVTAPSQGGWAQAGQAAIGVVGQVAAARYGAKT